MKKTSVDKFIYGSNMSESEKIKMWQDQHAFEIKNTFGITPNQLQSKMDNEAVQKVMKCVKGHLKYIVEDRDKLKKVNEDLEKPDLTEEKKVELKNNKCNLEKRKVQECEQTEEYLDRHINEKYGSSNVNVHTEDNIKYFKMVKGWFMSPPQGGNFADSQLIGDNYPPNWMEETINEY